MYRVLVLDRGLNVECLGLDSVDSLLAESYDSIDDLPDWAKERLAVLSIMPAPPPPTEVKGIGRRMSERVFWVYAPNTVASASA